jgi:hypothetical protein
VGGLGYGSSKSVSTGSLSGVSSKVPGKTVRIALNDPTDPQFSVTLADAELTSSLYDKCVVAIRRGETQARARKDQGSTLNVPDALAKLAELVERGYLTTAEFNEQKSVILHRSKVESGAPASRTTPWLKWGWTNPEVNRIPRGKLPNVVGATVAEALASLQTAGWSQFWCPDASGRGRALLSHKNWLVVEQGPAAGETVPKWERIWLRCLKRGEQL